MVRRNTTYASVSRNWYSAKSGTRGKIRSFRDGRPGGPRCADKLKHGGTVVAKERRLGRGLAALLGENREEMREDGTVHFSADVPNSGPSRPPEPADPQKPEYDAPVENELLMLGVHDIDDNPFQPRREFSEPEIVSLAESLKEHDMLQPVLVRRVGARWQLISGERRLRAAIRAGWTQVPARVRQADDRLVAELAIVENLQRKDLNPIEKALSFRRYLDEHQATQEELAKRLKIDRSTIANLLRLLELPQLVQTELASGLITNGHARAILPLGDEAEQIAFSKRIQTEGLSVRDTERIVGEKLLAEDELMGISTAKPKKKPRGKTSQIASLEQRLRIAIGTKVEIKQSGRGRGQLVIHFRGNDEFERLTKLILSAASDDVKSFAG